MASRVVLVVEDDESICKAIEAALAGQGYLTRTAGTVVDGLGIALTGPVDLLVLDINLPDGTAWELLERYRQSPGVPPTPVVVISSTRVSRAELRRRGIDRFVAKPFSMQYLVSVVSELLPSVGP